MFIVFLVGWVLAGLVLALALGSAVGIAEARRKPTVPANVPADTSIAA